MGKPTIRMQANEIRLVHEGGRSSLTFSGKLTAPEQAKLTAAVAQARTLPLLSVEAWPVERKRSLDANAYCWALCQAIAEKLSGPYLVTKEEIYQEQVRQVGSFTELSLSEWAAGRFCEAWAKNGLGWVTEEADRYGGQVTLLAYYGSSAYNTKEMARLIDALVQECHELGIETMEPGDLESLLRSWGRKCGETKDGRLKHEKSNASPESDPGGV